MANFFNEVGTGVAKGVWAGMKGVGSGAFKASKYTGHLLGGGVIGGMYGGLASDSQSSTGVVQDAMFGGLAGMGLVGAARLGILGAKAYTRPISKEAKALAKQRMTARAAETAMIKKNVAADRDLIMRKMAFGGDYEAAMELGRDVASGEKIVRARAGAERHALTRKLTTGLMVGAGLSTMTYGALSSGPNRAMLARDLPSTGYMTSYGVAPDDPGRIAFRESTGGLVQGMHSGRHG